MNCKSIIVIILVVLFLFCNSKIVIAGQSGGSNKSNSSQNITSKAEKSPETPQNNKNERNNDGQVVTNPVHVYYTQFNTVTIATANIGRWSFTPSSLSFETVAELERSHLLKSTIYVHNDNHPQGLEYTAGHGRMDVYLGRQLNSSVGTGGSYSVGGASGTGGGSARVTMIGIKLSPSTIAIYAGHTVNIFVRALYSNGTSQTVPASSVQWASSSPGVATVNQGTITAVSPGTAIITATYNGYTQSATVTVKAARTTVKSRLAK